ncbi:SNF2 domain-containing protein CLASSY 3-like [Durio zibethinus]|uniref:SNF2 domain-containing protein CLASSY 3-like n=1 Tax=Durio zibethinus TaxID=66656 RepID=A0A6P5WVK3_DURZI|nr:SNF2 domain-containing protein CLASSY 3-like [Durio zibethinus]
MSNQSMPVASRTRRKREALLFEEYRESKRRQIQEEVEERKAKTIMAMPESSTKDNISLASQQRTDQMQILSEESDIELEECKQDEKDPDLICLDSYDDIDDDDDDEDDGDSMEGSDEALTSTSGEDNDEYEDLDYYGDDYGARAVVLDKQSHANAKAKAKAEKVEFVSEHAGNSKKNSNGVDICFDEDVIDVTSSKTKSTHKKGRPASSNKLHLLKILADSILDNEDADSSSSGEDIKEETEDNSLPLKFTFGVEPTTTHHEKTEFEKEMDSLWTEMQFSLTSSEIGSTEPSLVEIEDADISDVKHDKATLCSLGNHQLVLDEEIGMKCKFCSFVQLEIKYISPPLMTQPCGKFERQHSGVVDSSIFDGLQYQDPNNDMPGCDLSADIKGTVWEIIPNLKSKLYPHQREGFEFIWNNISGGIYRDKSKNSSNRCGGCIISHAPGTGKTLLTIVFLQTYLKEYPSCRPVIVAPSSMLLTWEAEFRKWEVDIPFHNLNSQDFSGKEKTKGIDFYKKFEQGVTFPDRPLARRLVKLLSWKSDGGILGISYRLFEQLAGKENKGKQKCSTVDKLVSKILLELPGLFVLDEGHTPRNDDTHLWKALSRIKTERRIILSGTPFQNNFDELFNTLCLVRPKFVEGIQSRHREQVNKKRGQKGNEAKWKWDSLTGSIGKDVDKNEAEKLREVRAVIKPFVHVHKGRILQTTLPGLRHSVVALRPFDLQKKILERVKETKNALYLDYYVSLISIHPSLLQQVSDQKDINEIVSSIVRMDELERIRLKPDKGVKTKFLMELLKLSEALDEKVIVFSQYLEPLHLIMDQLKDFFKWKEGEEILFMHGKCDIKQRQCSINVFNDPVSKSRVLLASTKACSEGINLVGGSRVVLLDVTWNPSVERQAISRAYRLGQKRVVYIYHLISSGTMEGMKCYRQAGKDRLSELVFSSSDKTVDHHKKACNVLEDKVLEVMVQHEKLKSINFILEGTEGIPTSEVDSVFLFFIQFAEIRNPNHFVGLAGKPDKWTKISSVRQALDMCPRKEKHEEMSMEQGFLELAVGLVNIELDFDFQNNEKYIILIQTFIFCGDKVAVAATARGRHFRGPFTCLEIIVELCIGQMGIVVYMTLRVVQLHRYNLELLRWLRVYMDNLRNSGLREPRRAADQCWTPPRGLEVKINVDAA